MTRIGATNPNSIKTLTHHPIQVVAGRRRSFGAIAGLHHNFDSKIIFTRHNVLDLFSENR